MIFPFSFLTGGKSKKERKKEIHSKSINREIFEQRGSFGTLVSRIEFRNWETSRGSRVAVKYTTTYVVQECFFFFFYWENPKAKATSWKAALCGRLGERGFEFSKGTQRALDATTAMVRNDSFEDKLHTFLRFFFLSFLFNVYLKMHFLMRKYRQWDKWEKKRMIR